ncbi:hypothetical protein ACJIZ3_005064 [Penstemon smallii]|uniref:BZIP domain-containing protein n=1 Tax=Penstemon smallii TaxID=265156 RepID=A0ABD3S3S2_9LAMI
MTAADEDWVKSAMKDDTMVVELLVRLHRAAPPPPPPALKPAALPLEWSVRQRRSRPVSISSNTKKPAHRASPTTPLSWSGGTSLSGGSGGFEESSRPKLSNTARSKANVDGEKTGSKRSRKKKTLAELREEENLLIKERRELKRQISALRVNFEKQRATNESLKRMKLEMQPHLDKRKAEESVSGQLEQKSTGNHPITTSLLANDAASDDKFELPDLNIPFEDSISDVVCGVR